MLKLRQEVLRRFKFDLGDGFHAGPRMYGSHLFDPVRDYLDTLAWDGKHRLDQWLIDYCKATDTPLNRAFGRKVLMVAVRRVRSPGCKFDFILVLEGEQGIGKSTMLKILRSRMNPDAWEAIIRRRLTTLMATLRKKSAGYL